ncbi:hypothetical protein LCGC14_0975100 [marine sediment metagenome]|uniref:Uncharacterized protein n=1 Tax=marine sediment metagenome TaxID=412755 RepID=A0A0F9NAF0_9ZZZZ|nr:hypothetical protein [Candidatus Aminicenantes bacterium]HEB35210.1 hypothetical protein [Candidatus Aminicenantes bacterium]
MVGKNNKLKELVNSSGFPFQLAVENEIKSISSQTPWSIIAREHPWRNINDKDEGFIDLVIGYGAVRLVLECKRPRGGLWVFLISDKRQESVKKFRVCWAHCKPNRSDLVGWNDFDILPMSPESEFCVIRGKGENTKPLLERLGRYVLSSTEALAVEELNLIRSPQIDHLRLLVPVIVTSAELKVCKLSPEEISISNGTITDSEFKTVPWIRFRKSLAVSEVEYSMFNELSEITEKKERSLFVINSSNLSNFLKKWDFHTPSYSIPWDLARQIEE